MVGLKKFVRPAVVSGMVRRWGGALLFTTLLLLSRPAASAAELIRYKDSKGRIFYVNDPAKVPNEYQGSMERAPDLPPVSKVPASKQAPVVRPRSESTPHYRASSDRRVILLVAPGCPYCLMAEELLKKKRVTYKRLDINKDEEGRVLYQSLGGGGVPILKVGTKVVRGFDPIEIVAAVGRGGT